MAARRRSGPLRETMMTTHSEDEDDEVMMTHSGDDSVTQDQSAESQLLSGPYVGAV